MRDSATFRPACSPATGPARRSVSRDNRYPGFQYGERGRAAFLVLVSAGGAIQPGGRSASVPHDVGMLVSACMFWVFRPRTLSSRSGASRLSRPFRRAVNRRRQALAQQLVPVITDTRRGLIECDPCNRGAIAPWVMQHGIENNYKRVERACPALGHVRLAHAVPESQPSGGPTVA